MVGFSRDPQGYDVTPPAQLAVRLLQGAGRAVLHAYAEPAAPALDVLAHDRTPDGRVVVAIHLPDEVATMVGTQWRALAVRLHVEKLAELPSVRIQAADVHALGTLRTLDPATEDLELNWEFDLALGGPGVVLAEMRVERLLLHGPSGVTRLDLDALPTARAFPSAWESLDALDALMLAGEGVLTKLAEGVALGIVPGEILNEAPPAPTCHLHAGQTYPVDVTATAVTVLQVRENGMRTIAIEFPEPVSSAPDVALAIDFLRTHEVAPYTWS